MKKVPAASSLVFRLFKATARRWSLWGIFLFVLPLVIRNIRTRLILLHLYPPGPSPFPPPAAPSKEIGKNQTDKSTPSSSVKSVLLPPPMDLWRRNISLETAYRISPRKRFDNSHVNLKNCSCLNPEAQLNCCKRYIRLSHKMGFVLSHQLFDTYRPLRLAVSEMARETHALFPPDGGDFRDVILFRNIYESLKSGYLYHRTGRECWMGINGNPISSEQAQKNFGPIHRWRAVIQLKEEALPMSLHRNRSLCQFLQEEDEKVGMRVYIDLVFHGYYHRALSHWALAQNFPEVRERTKHACYEDFLSPTKDKKAIEDALSFLFNTTTEWKGDLPGKAKYDGGHSTSKTADAEQSKRLLEIIRELDNEVFNNEIEWVDSVIPC